MRLLHLGVELIYKYEYHSNSISEQLYRKLSGKSPRGVIKHTREPGIVMRSSKKKEIVDWDKESCNIINESGLPASDCFERMVQLLETVNKIAHIDELAERRLITHWLMPGQKYSFKLLESMYRETMMTQQPIWGNTFDSSVIIDAKIGGLTLHHQSGAMKPKQLREDYLIFKAQNIPKVFLFLLASIESKKMIKYSPVDIHNFLNNAFEQCENHSNLFENIWSEVL